ncbi:MAG TPA: cytidine deaminase [Chitinophagaceae bacterium]|nr:cytidine deaminase [Chitinophagaceae bacterium]
MNKSAYSFSYEVYNSIDDLNKEDAWLLQHAKETSKAAYAPYSNFQVGAAARLLNGEIVKGTNQENASYPVGICAERVLLSTAAMLHPQVPITSIAISYRSNTLKSDHPIAPCGICRQSLQEYEQRVHNPIRLILGGMDGKVIIIEKASMLLPLSFTANDLLA